MQFNKYIHTYIHTYIHRYIQSPRKDHYFNILFSLIHGPMKGYHYNRLRTILYYRSNTMYVCMVITYSKCKDQPGEVANPARGQLNREHEYLPIPVRARAFGLARRVWQSRPASACLSPYSGGIWYLPTGFPPSSAVASICLFKPPNAIESVPSLSGHAIAYRWRSLRRVHRHRASKPQGSSKRMLPWQVTMDQFICVTLSHTHYWL